MKRSPLKRKTPLAPSRAHMRRTRLAPMSRKRRAEIDQWQQLRQLVMARDGGCQLAVRMDGHHCDGQVEIHHIRRRSQGGKDVLPNLIQLCARAHRWVHDNPAEATLFGLLILRPENGQ